MRLFIAIELPGDVKKTLARLRADIPGARWVPVEQLHLTLSFLGEVDNATTKLLVDKLAQIKASEFNIRFAEAGCFPNQRQPRVLWVGLKPEPLLNNLASMVRNVALSCNIPQEERPFSPHITLARIRQQVKQPITAFFDLYQKQELPSIPVREFILFQSQLTPQGALHTPLKSFFFVISAQSGFPQSKIPF